MEPLTVLLLLAALVLGAVVGYLLALVRRGADPSARVEVAALTSRLEASRAELTTAERRHLRDLASAQERQADEIDRLNAAHAAERERIERESDRRLDELRADTARLSAEFEALSRRALAANSETFLAQAAERLRRSQSEQDSALAQREEAVRALVAPLESTLAQVKQEVTSAEKARLAANAALAQQVQGMRESSEALRTETSALVTALRAPQVRGRWGELQLRRTVEAAGLVEHVDFEEQVVLDGGRLRPDLVVSLPQGRRVVVDAKVSFSGYLEAMEARDDSTRRERLRAHARQLRNHVNDLAGKEYWANVEGAPEFTVMFVPSEVFLEAALREDPALQEHAFDRSVVIATPATLVTLLRTVAYTWRQDQLAAEARQVLTLGRELHKRLATFGHHLAEVSRRLNATVESFNRMSASLDSRVVPQLQRFASLQGLPDLPEAPAPLDLLAAPPRKEDLFHPVPASEVAS